jgi:enoyl-CoA hydratase
MDASSRYQTITLDRRDDVVTLWLNRPTARNAMNITMCEEFIAIFGALRPDPMLRLVLIRARGTAFCGGADLHEIRERGGDPDWYLRRRNLGLDAFLAVETCPAPVAALVDGAAVGSGCEIAAAADFIIATVSATFQWPEALWGGVGATQRLARCAGIAMAKELLFTARRIDAEEARRIGMVNRIVPTDGLNAAADALSAEVVRCYPLAVRLIKRAIVLGHGLDLRSAVDIERELISCSLASSEWRAGADAFAAAVGRQATARPD